MSEPSRVQYSFGMKLTTGSYENATFNISLTSDVGETETHGDALKRVTEFVEEAADKKFSDLRSVYLEKKRHGGE